MKTRARNRHLRRLQDAFFEQSFVTDGENVFEYDDASCERARNASNTRNSTRNGNAHGGARSSVDLHLDGGSDEDEENAEEERVRGDQGVGQGAATVDANVRADDLPVPAPHWTRVTSLKQFVIGEARSRLCADDITDLARRFLQLVPTLSATPLVSSASSHVEESRWFAQLKSTIDAHIQQGRGELLWTLHDGEHLYIAHRIPLDDSTKEPSARQVRRGKWRCLGGGAGGTIEAFVRSAFRKAFPGIIEQVLAGQRDDADVKRVCTAGEFYLREQVPCIDRECILSAAVDDAHDVAAEESIN